MTKRKKKKLIYSAILLALGIIIVLISLFFVKYKTVDNYMTARAYHYLSAKYDADESEFILIDYDKAHWFLNDDDFPELEYSNYKWEFEYNGREFFVNMDGKEFYDDYQLEDVNEWVYNWLTENIDKNIVDFTADSDSFKIYYGASNVSRTNVISEKEIFDFIKYNIDEDNFIIILYCKEENSTQQKLKLLKSKTSKKFIELFNEEVPVAFTSNYDGFSILSNKIGWCRSRALK